MNGIGEPANTLSGILWTGGEKALVYGVNFVQGIILARLLNPEDFGITAMLGIFLGLGGCFAESGLGTALVVSRIERGDRVEGDVLKWNVGVACGMYLLLSLAAPAIAAWYGKPILKPLLWAMAAGLVVNAASVVAFARLTREQRFDRLAWVNSASSIVGSFAGVLLAWMGFGVWSIVGLGLVGAVVRTTFAWYLAKGTPPSSSSPDPFAFSSPSPDSFASFSSLLSYGWKLMLSGIIHTFYAESYNLVIGKMWSPAAVGLFIRGKRWASLPGDVVNDVVGRVSLPKMVQERRTETQGRWTVLNAMLLWPGLLVLFAFAPQIVGFVLGPKWLDCVPYLRIMIVGQLFTPIASIALNRIRASGRAELVLKTDAWKKPLGLAALAAGIPFGVVGLCWASVASDFFEAAADVWYAHRASLCPTHGSP